MFKRSTLLLALAVTLASCSQDPVTPTQADSPIAPESSNQGTTLQAAPSLKQQTLSTPGADVTLYKGALNNGATFEIRRAGDKPVIPPVAGVNSSFIMGEVPGKTFMGAWTITTTAEKLNAPATLTLKPETGLSGQAAKERVTEVFVRDNTDGHVIVVGTFKGDAQLAIEDFGDRINEARGKTVDLTYFAYSAPLSAYNETCIAQGGITTYGYCSFSTKQSSGKTSLKGQALKSQGGVLTSQSLYLRNISWNLGNVASSCSTTTAGANYNFKLCYSSTVRRISDQILAFEQTYKPDIIMIQESFNGRCDYTSESFYGNYINQRLCADGVPRVNAMQMIFGPSGTRYNWACTDTENLPNSQAVVNGYECVALDAGYFKFAPYTFFNPPNTALHPSCVDAPDYSRNFLGRDTGYQVTNIKSIYNPTNTLTVVNAHLAGTNASACRSAQLLGLEDSYLTNGQTYRLFAGDWNTEPLNDSTIGGQNFREVFSGPWASYSSTLGRAIDNVTDFTAYYGSGFYNLALDHVMSNTFTGSCTRGSNFDGTDHTWTDCRLSSSSF